MLQCITSAGNEGMINDMHVCSVDESAASIIVTESDNRAVKVFEFSPTL